jgi:hypothetical protein
MPATEIRHQLRMWLIRPEDAPLLWWENDFYSLEEAKAKTERLADQNLPPIMAH